MVTSKVGSEFGGRVQQVRLQSLGNTHATGLMQHKNTDHRGTPEKPGRTVTLHRDDDAVTWGRAFEIAGTPLEQQETLKYLELREKQYDIREYVDVVAASPADMGSDGIPQQAMTRADLIISDPTGVGHDIVAVEGCLVYIAGLNPTTNPNFLGPVSLEAISLQIATSCGPSGPNNDEELFSLEGMVVDQIKKAEAACD